MPDLVPGIHVSTLGKQHVDGRDEPGHDERLARRPAQPSISSPVGIGTFSGSSFTPAASPTVSRSAAKSFSR